MFWLIIFIPGATILTFILVYRVDHERGWSILLSLGMFLVAAWIAALVGSLILPAVFDNFAEQTSVVIDDKELMAFPDDNYMHISDIGYETFHYTMREKTEDGRYRDFTLNSTDYFNLVYADENFHCITTRATFSNPIVKFFTIYWEKDITVIIPAHSIALEDDLYVES